jgi:hypothetical protein
MRGSTIDHLGRYRDMRMKQNPKLTVEYFISAAMNVHNGYCKSKYADELCDIAPSDKLVQPTAFVRN